MRKVDIIFFIIAFLMQGLLLALKGLRWFLLNANGDARFIQSMGEFLESYAIGIITPGRLGELMKVGYQKDTASKVNAGIRVLVERGLDFGFFILIAGVSIGWGGMIISNLQLGSLIVCAGILSILFSVILASSKKMFVFFVRIFKKLTVPKKFLSTKLVFLVLVISLLSNLAYFISCYLLAYGISLPVSLITVSGEIGRAHV